MPDITGKDAVKFFVEEVPGIDVIMLTVSQATDELVDN
jgi:hypothetical protein